MNTHADSQVRRATTADVPALATLRFEFRSRNKPPVESAADFLPRCIDWMRPRVADAATWRVWVLERDAAIVGNIWLEIVEKLPNPNVETELHGYVTNFFVRPQHRNAGAGSRLLQAVLEDCRRSEVDSVFLWPSERSRPLYERFGFVHPSEMLILAQR
jgi:N-acetylglutamate synthase-like GNAT family acetyltransferase